MRVPSRELGQGEACSHEGCAPCAPTPLTEHLSTVDPPGCERARGGARLGKPSGARFDVERASHGARARARSGGGAGLAARADAPRVELRGLRNRLGRSASTLSRRAVASTGRLDAPSGEREISSSSSTFRARRRSGGVSADPLTRRERRSTCAARVAGASSRGAKVDLAGTV